MMKTTDRLRAAAGAVCFIAGSTAAPSATAEGWLDPPVSGGTQFHRNLDGAGLEALVTTLRESDRMAIDIEASLKSGCLEANRQCLTYDVVSAKNASGRKWRLEGGLSPEEYSALWNAAKGQGMRPVDIEVDRVLYYYQGFDAGRYNEEINYAALFVENTEGLVWASYSRQNDLEYQDTYLKRVQEQGMTVVDYESYTTQYSGGPYYAAIFVKDKDGRTAISQRGLTKASFETTRADLMGKGFWPLFVNTVDQGRYAVTWLKDPNVEAKAFTALTLDEMNDKNGDFADDGYARVDVERRDSHWGSIWFKRTGGWRVNPAVVGAGSKGPTLKAPERKPEN